jgi:hypothetical protein
VQAGDFSPHFTGSLGGQLDTTYAAPSNGNATWTLKVTGLSGNGTVQLNQVQGSNIHDSAGNLLTETFNGQTYTVVTNPATLTLAQGYSIMAPALMPTDSTNVFISMDSTSTYYLLGNSSSSVFLLDGNLFPNGSTVLTWNSPSYSIFIADTSSSTGWYQSDYATPVSPPIIGQNQGFFVLPSQPMAFALAGWVGSPNNLSYLLSNATVTDSNNNTYTITDAIQLYGLLSVYHWNATQQVWDTLGWNPNDTITSWNGYFFDNTAGLTLTVTFGYPT